MLPTSDPGILSETCGTYKSDDHAILGSVVLVLILRDELQAGSVVGLSSYKYNDREETRT